ncbi:MAG: hypothetical protein QXL86_03980 [Candidatus Aenigmatarchaeota archaeon]
MLAQVSIEFISFVAVLFILLVIVLYYNFDLYFQMNSVKIFKEAQTISDQVASEINFALKAGDGYSRIFFLQPKISNSIDYTIKIENYRVIVSWDGGSVQSAILTKNVSGNFLNGRNMIRNSEGMIYVNQ